MSENENGLKRSLEQVIEDTVTDERKKQKVIDEQEIASTSTLVTSENLQETENLIMDKETTLKSDESSTSVIETKDMDQNMVSADLKKAVTAVQENLAETTKTPTTTEDASITSEQLLIALTSAPPEEATLEPVKPVETKIDNPPPPPPPPQQQQQQQTDTKDVNELISEENTSKLSSVIKESLAPSLTGLGITPKESSSSILNKPSFVPPQSKPTGSSSSTPNVSSTSSPLIGSALPLKFNNKNSTDSISPSLTSATSISVSNLPDIKAALRRLSSANVTASVIEQLSSSPRLPNIGALNERKGSTADISPSEILGNALAAVAANAARTTTPNTTTSITTTTNNTTTTTNTNTKSSSSQSTNNNTSTNNTAAAIGNLAANISNLLHSGFHRNSISQEDTQKLAAAVAGARTNDQQEEEQRRKSSIALVGNAFSNMMDMIGRNKTIDNNATNNNNNNNFQKPTPPPPSVPAVAAVPAIPAVKPKLIIKNDQVFKAVEGIEEKFLGYHLYSPHLLLPNLENCVNGILEVRIPARFLTFENEKVKKQAIWGTEIYTDDSDIVGMIIHSGQYQPEFIEPKIESGDPLALAIAGKQKESVDAARKLAMSGKKYVHRYDHLIPDHDLKVTLRVLPKLKVYSSSIRNNLKSREWHQHDGMSLYVNKVEKIQKGEARLKGKSTLKSNMFVYEPYRKKLLLTNEKKNTEPVTMISTGRIKKSQRVMRMFQIRSELMNKEKQ